MNFDFAVVLDESQLAEAIHEVIDTRPGCPNHFRQHFLTYFGNDLLRRLFFAKLREQQKDPGQALFTGIEELIHRSSWIRALRARRWETKISENLCSSRRVRIISFRSILSRTQGVIALALATRSGWMWQCILPTKLPRAQQGDGCFFSCSGYYAEPDPAALNVIDIVGSITLAEGTLLIAKMKNCSAHAGGGKKCRSIKVALFFKWKIDIDDLVSLGSMLSLHIESSIDGVAGDWLRYIAVKSLCPIPNIAERAAYEETRFVCVKFSFSGQLRGTIFTASVFKRMKTKQGKVNSASGSLIRCYSHA